MVPLYEQVYLYILNEIKNGKLKSGDRVPSEKELAEQFHVSRITSKKALENLMQAQIVERIRGKGTFVVQTLPDLHHLDSQAPGDVELHHERRRREQPLIGVILEDFSSSYGTRLLQAIEERCSEHHIHMLMKRTYGQREEEKQAIDAFVQMGVDGLIVFPVHGDYYNPKLLKLVVDSFPLVLVDRYLKGIAAHSVYIDNRKAAYELTTYLLQRGHTHIAFASPPLENTSSIDERLQGFSSALADHGLQLNPNYCFTRLQSTLSASHIEDILAHQQDVCQFIEMHPHITAIIACEYVFALFLKHVLQSTNPQRAAEIKIVCFDHPDHLFGPPQFTYIQQDETTMGHQAVDVLFEQLQGHATTSLQSIIPHALIQTRE